MGKIIQTCLAVLLLVPVPALAETAYVIDKIEVGLHQDNNLDSPIMKLLSTGSELEILARDDEMSQVRDESGTTGWVKNEFLQPGKPTRRLFEEVSSRNQQLKNEITKLQAQIRQSGNDQELEALTAENERLKQEIKSARLEAGELQAELTRLHNSVPASNGAAGSDNQALYSRISELEQQKIALEEELQSILNPEDDGSLKQELLSLQARSDDIKRHLIYTLVLLIVGIIAGVIIYDLIHRRRHSGFRV